MALQMQNVNNKYVAQIATKLLLTLKFDLYLSVRTEGWKVTRSAVLL